MFRRGTAKGFRGVIIRGGQEQPISRVGLSLLWKKAQKKALKNMTSEVMNRIIAHANPAWTFVVWSPIRVASRVTSRHHRVEIKRRKARFKKRGVGDVLNQNR